MAAVQVRTHASDTPCSRSYTLASADRPALSLCTLLSFCPSASVEVFIANRRPPSAFSIRDRTRLARPTPASDLRFISRKMELSDSLSLNSKASCCLFGAQTPSSATAGNSRAIPLEQVVAGSAKIRPWVRSFVRKRCAEEIRTADSQIRSLRVAGAERAHVVHSQNLSHARTAPTFQA